MKIEVFSAKLDGGHHISPDFRVGEFACHDKSDKIVVDTDFVQDKLQAIRDHFGAPISITSGYRTASWNRKCGGATHSYHMRGQAFDIVVKGVDIKEVAQYAVEIGVKGVIMYTRQGFVHVDSRDAVYHAINAGGKIIKTSNFK